MRGLPIPDDLLSRLREDPTRAPEIIALASAHLHAPQADKWIAKQRSRYSHDDASFASAAKAKHATLARFEGAVTGVGGIITMIPDLVGLAWIQSRLCFYVAAAYGYDPYDPMRPAEMLVLHDVYEDPITARKALDGEMEHMALHYVDRKFNSNIQRDEALAVKLMTYVGKRGAKRAAGRMIPGFAILFNATANELDTRRLADKAIRFYGGEPAKKKRLLRR
ncbi:MAG: EcsC family protein [Solirubrobacteraceae bacterium]|nr:EcsC family protein [Solirubrobacteraceae bacterium]